MKLKPYPLHTIIVGSFIALVLLLGFSAYLYINKIHTDQLISDRGAVLRTLAKGTATVLAKNMKERRREVELLAQTPLFVHAPLDSKEFDTSLARLHRSYAHYSWIGLTDTQGKVLHATNDNLLGADVSARPWFQHASQEVYVGDLHEAKLLAGLLPNKTHEWPVRFIDFASPVYDEGGKLRAVLGAHAHWRWTAEAISEVMPEGAAKRKIEIFIVNGNNEIIYPDHPEKMPGNPMAPKELKGDDSTFDNWGGKDSYLTTVATVGEPVVDGKWPLGWKVVVRQPRSQVLSEVDNLEKDITLGLVAVGLIFVSLAWLLGHFISRPIIQLAKIAKQVSGGDEKIQFNVSVNSRELKELNSAIENMAVTLLARKHALEDANHDLMSTVAERTAELEAANNELRQLARRDTLTGLPNRLAAKEQLLHEFNRMMRSQEPYAVLMMDIDFFKRVNDTYGHAAGDTVLTHVATQVQASLRKTDFVGRIGGEEFLVILPMTNHAGAMSIAEKVRAHIESSPVDPVGKVTVSIGVSVAALDQSDAEMAVKQADQYLYKAKQTGRNQIASL
ncbi:diguanylate cyclase [Undibacterium oligocarboniphilum]|uniref:diguanylate cyclase n=1 Tax=Undibacterium oligocarboniphilum TaxID=666702 RepID=A0A850QJL4_9BURK|nr:diguanylate cyclase [Undibacterium oligocarboniphilum]NVO76614.1 diguanylate cyclase [Undibacterium oligocarboniphilum]